MKNHDSMTTTTYRHPEAWYSFPQTFPVPEGWKYRTYADLAFATAQGNTEIDLYCDGDWLEMISPDGKECIRHEIF